MSAINQVGGPSRSTENFTAIFEVAASEYQKVTEMPLDTHPFATQLDKCDSPQSFSDVLMTQAQALSTFRKGDKKLELMTWLDPIVHILFTFSATLGEGIGIPFSPAKTIFTGIGVLLAAVKDAAAERDTLIRLFERIYFFVQRLNGYTGIPLTNEFTELLGKIMAQILSILAISTKAMTQRRMKKVLKKLIGRSDVEDALLRLDLLTKEESLMAVAKNLQVAHHVDDNVNEIKVLAEDIDDKVQVIGRVDANVKTTNERMDELRRNELQERLQKWLSPPDPSINHNNACKTQHRGTASWFIQGSTFREWKENGSLLWILGNPGAGKSVLCSAIIEDIKNMREERSALVAYHYFDFKDATKSHVHGLLASLLSQLGDDSDACWDILHGLFNTCRDGSERPSDGALVECLGTMLKLSGKPIFIITDALDECPSTTGTPSAREEVLNFVEDLIGSNHSNLFICITSRPEQDIQAVLNPLTSASRRVSLHEERGQMEDIRNYVRSFVHADRAMRRWREEDKEIVIKTLSDRAGGMFRWVSCQLDTLRRCFPPSIRKTLDELPVTLDETYERTLEGVPKEKRHHAHRLFQCLVAAIRPLHVEELAEIFAIDFDVDTVTAPNLMDGWRPENPEEAILSACSTLITVIDDDKDSKIVQFSHFSVKEFLISDRLRTSKFGNIRNDHIRLDAAHTLLARVCLTVLLQLDEKTVKKRLATFPLALYAAQHWFEHAKYEDVAPHVQDAMEELFNPDKPYLTSWAWIHDVDQREFRESTDTVTDNRSRPEGTALYYAVSCGLIGPAKYLISTHGEDVNAKCGYRGTPLHAASNKGHVDAVSLLLDHGAEMNAINEHGRTPLWDAYYGGHPQVMQLLLEHGADPDARCGPFGLLTHQASFYGQTEVVRLLLQHRADVDATTAPDNDAPLYWASSTGHADVAEILLEHGAKINALTNGGTPLYWAVLKGHLDVTRLLLERGADMQIRGRGNLTPFQVATRGGHTQITQLLLEHGADKD